ncbi:2-hydroxyglutaryl-CoA dehydratase [bacterium]|nr:2-hydroxyglutaryl-CoA dehydratase [bacterium]
MIYAGIDAGSRAIKVAVYDAQDGRVLATGVADQGVRQAELARELYRETLARANGRAAEVRRSVATGYGRNLVDFADTTITEITCHAAGVRFWQPEARTVIEIGGQDSKLIRLNARGGVQDFAMNDRCAAGTGRFLEVIAARLALPLSAVGEMCARSKQPATISSMCVVFAETEIIGLLATGAPPEDILAGVCRSLATRMAAMAGRRLDAPIFFTGGVAMIPGMAEAMASALGHPVEVCPQPQMTGAVGAALLAAQS